MNEERLVQMVSSISFIIKEDIPKDEYLKLFKKGIHTVKDYEALKNDIKTLEKISETANNLIVLITEETKHLDEKLQ
jgi:hypothetical protein